MRLTAFQRYQYTAQVWLQVPSTQPSGPATYEPLEIDFKFDFMTDPRSPRQVLVTRTPLPLRTILQGIIDQNGEAIMGNAQYQIRTIEPMLNVFGKTEGYKMTTALTVESDYAKLLTKDPTGDGTIGGGSET